MMLTNSIRCALVVSTVCLSVFLCIGIGQAHSIIEDPDIRGLFTDDFFAHSQIPESHVIVIGSGETPLFAGNHSDSTVLRDFHILGTDVTVIETHIPLSAITEFLGAIGHGESSPSLITTILQIGNEGESHAEFANSGLLPPSDSVEFFGLPLEEFEHDNHSSSPGLSSFPQTALSGFLSENGHDSNTFLFSGNVEATAGIASAVPEPGSIVLLGTGLVGLIGWLGRRSLHDRSEGR